MTDVASLKPHAEPQLSSVAAFGGPPPFALANGSPTPDNNTIEEEDSSTIKCICGFPDDDGSTVFCEKCLTWQHVICYYDNLVVPEVHECTDCSPRPVDVKRAKEEQRQRRESFNERKAKAKTAAKGSHKKKVKDIGAIQPNGWALHTNSDLLYGTDRKSGSPRDQPPPAKRPKTTHKTTGSVSAINLPPTLPQASRKRATSTLHNGQSPVKSPTSPEANGTGAEDFSPEFIRLYRQPEAHFIDSNSYTDLGLANDISLWLNDRDALAEATGGMEPGQIFERIEESMEHLDSLAPVIHKQTEEDPTITAHGMCPRWEFLVVEALVPAGSYIGELKGHIGRKSDYSANVSDRWNLLQHPEPFVFFPPYLPIYIDTRQEGTMLRYTRRSCNPNMAMKILTHSREGGYHFCFVATTDIQPGDELTIGWEISTELRQMLMHSVTNGELRKEGFKKIEHFTQWVSCVLANFGGCACDTSMGRECLLERARRPNNNQLESLQPPKTVKSRKTKKTQVSPLSTGHATNSRAGSEAFSRDVPEDDRSTSGSRSKPGSRDITPMTHLSVEGGGGDVKMSDRERRKLQQQERLFEQLEYDEQHGGKRKKRNSAGSTLNTPSIATSKQLGHPEPSPSALSAFNSKTRGLRKASASRKANGGLPKPRPVYVNVSTQTDRNPATTPMSPAPARKPAFVRKSFKRKLVDEANKEKMHREEIRQQVKTEVQSPVLLDVAVNKFPPVIQPSHSLQPAVYKDSSTTVLEGLLDAPENGKSGDACNGQDAREERERPSPLAEQGQDKPSLADHVEPPRPSVRSHTDTREVDMRDAPADEVQAANPQFALPDPEQLPDAPPSEAPPATSHSPTQLLPLPLPGNLSKPPIQTTTSGNSKPTDLHVQMPPREDFASQPAITNLPVVTPGSTSSVITGGSLAQSPPAMNMPTPFSPSVTSAVAPTPVRKKLSLSDYTRAKAKRNTDVQAQTSRISASPPTLQPQTSQTQGSSPTISNAALPLVSALSTAKPTGPENVTPEPGFIPSAPNEDAKPHPPPPLFRANS